MGGLILQLNQDIKNFLGPRVLKAIEFMILCITYFFIWLRGLYEVIFTSIEGEVYRGVLGRIAGTEHKQTIIYRYLADFLKDFWLCFWQEALIKPGKKNPPIFTSILRNPCENVIESKNSLTNTLFFQHCTKFIHVFNIFNAAKHAFGIYFEEKRQIYPWM